MTFDVNTGVGQVADLVTTVINKIWPDKSEQEKQELAAALTVVQGQLEINKVEAGSTSMFVSGWRPAIGWVCGAACAWNWIGLSIVNTLAVMVNHPLNLSPANVSEMMPILMGLLGLGALRTVEKVQGVARN